MAISEKVRLLKLRAKIGGELDEALDERIEALKKVDYRENVSDFLWFGHSILRSLNYRKESVQDVANTEELMEIWESEREKPYSEQFYMGHFMDAQASAFVGFARRIISMPQELIDFEIDVLTQVLAWADTHPKNFEHRTGIENELKARQEGKDTSFKVTKALDASTPAPVKNYKTALDELPGEYLPAKPSAHDLMIQAMKESGRVNFKELETPLTTEEALDAEYEELQRKYKETLFKGQQ